MLSSLDVVPPRRYLRYYSESGSTEEGKHVRRRERSDREAIVRRVIEEGVNERNLSVFDELISTSIVDREAEGSEPGGPEGEKEMLSSVRESFPTGGGR